MAIEGEITSQRIIEPSELDATMQEFPRLALFEFVDDTSVDPPVAELWLLGAAPNSFDHDPQHTPGPIELSTGVFQGYELPRRLGNSLTDRSATPDGYRFHDALHIGLMTYLGWSGVMRQMLEVRRRSDQRVDSDDDGPRPLLTEEGMFNVLSLFDKETEPTDFNNMLGMAAKGLKRTLDKVTHSYLALEADRTPVMEFSEKQIVNAIQMSMELFAKVKAGKGGYVLADLDGTTNPDGDEPIARYWAPESQDLWLLGMLQSKS